MVSFTANVLLPLSCLVSTLHALSVPKHAIREVPTIDLGYAKYQGLRLQAGVDQFLGMRYAKAPLGSLRFRAPRDPTPQTELQDASKFGPICVGTAETVNPGRAEDCLFVNVFKPSEAGTNAKLPVWVYIQGGGYSTNSNANYNSTGVVNKSGNNIVFVNFNYRVGALGFLAGEKVRQDGDLNAGLLDQRKLLHWVQKHISKFGGDPEHVVIHGASAGGGSVLYHMTAYEGKIDNRLFTGAIPESPFWPTQRTVAAMEFQYQRLLQNTKCSDLNCLRSVEITAFMAASTNAPFPDAAANNPLPLWYWLPVIDGTLVRDRVSSMLSRGSFIRVPVLVGHDTNEGSYFAYNAASGTEMSTFLKNNYPRLDAAQLERIHQLYPLMEPLPKHAAYFPSASEAYGDCTFTCPSHEIASTLAGMFDPDKTWGYRYNVLDPVNIANGLGVPHTFESAAIFGAGNTGGAAAASYYSTNAGIVPVTMSYFISFIRGLNPNSFKEPMAPTWGPWGSGSGQRIRLQTNETGMEAVPSELIQKCDLWRSLAETTEF